MARGRRHRNARRRLVADLTLLADLAIDYGCPVAAPDLGVVAVPDVVLLAEEADGLPIPDGYTARRTDGRSVRVYLWDGPDEAA